MASQVLVIEPHVRRAATLVSVLRAAGYHVELAPPESLLTLRHEPWTGVVVAASVLVGALEQLVTVAPVSLLLVDAAHHVVFETLRAHRPKDFVFVNGNGAWAEEVALRLRFHEALLNQDRCTTIHDVTVDELSRRVSRGDHVIELTATELDVLCHLLRRRGEVVSHDELCKAVLRRGSTVASLKSHVMRLRQKLGPAVASRLCAVRGKGFRLDA